MYTLDFAAQVSRICMDEIRRRGLKERKILRKSVPNSVLLLKVFKKQHCTADDLTHVSIHSVATLMQDTLWCCQERIVPKKVWRVINYETCTLNDLSRFISKRGENLLVEILDFLVQVMRYKEENEMDAYHLGEAMGKVTLGPADCDPIIAEKAGHFLTRMIIEHSKSTIQKEKQEWLFNRVDSGFATCPPASPVSSSNNKKQPAIMSKSEAARAKAKSYNRLIKKIRTRNFDWLNNANVALYALLENDYQPEPPSLQEPYLSIFSKHLEPSDAILSPVLFRLVTEASKPIEPIPQDPFVNSYLFNKNAVIENQVKIAFDDFMPLLLQSNKTNQQYQDYMNEKYASSNKSHLKIINSSFSHMKLNIKKHISQGAQHGDNMLIPEEETFMMTSSPNPQQQQQEQSLSLPVAASAYHQQPQQSQQQPENQYQSQQKQQYEQLQQQKQKSYGDLKNTSTATTNDNSDAAATNSNMLHSPSDYSNTSNISSSNNNNNSNSMKRQHQVKNMMKRVIKIGTIVPMKKTTIY